MKPTAKEWVMKRFCLVLALMAAVLWGVPGMAQPAAPAADSPSADIAVEMEVVEDDVDATEAAEEEIDESIEEPSEDLLDEDFDALDPDEISAMEEEFLMEEDGVLETETFESSEPVEIETLTEEIVEEPAMDSGFMDEAVTEEVVEQEELIDLEAEEFVADEEDLDRELVNLEMEESMAPGAEVDEDQTSDLITISLDDVPIQDVVRMFTRISGANIVAGTNLQGNVTVSLQDVEWEPALRVILDSVDLAMVEKDAGIFSILSKSDLASEPVTVDTLFLKFITVKSALPIVQRMLVSTNSSASGFASANAIVVQETAVHLERIKATIEKIDIPRMQVFIEAKFVELNQQAIKDLGINWSVLESYGVGLSEMKWSVTEERGWQDSRSATMTESDTRAQDDALGYGFDVNSLGLVGTFTGGDRTVDDDINRSRDIGLDVVNANSKSVSDVRTAILSADEFKMTLSALKQNDGVDVVSNPKILVASGEKATIHVGREEPNVTASPQGDQGDRYAYSLDKQNPIKTGVTVEVTPIVNTRDNISIKITPELSRKLGDVEMGGDAKLTFPILSTRKVDTDFSLESGRTVAIGGLTETRDEEQVNKIPLLGDIPIIGKYLFSHTHTQKVQDEVIIFVTVSLAEPESLREESGIPEGGRLIHQHLTREHLF
jgi:type IV pilus assembly protein PilQ